MNARNTDDRARILELIASASGRPLADIQADAHAWLLTFQNRGDDWVTTETTRLDVRKLLIVLDAIEMLPASDEAIARLTHIGAAVRSLVVAGAMRKPDTSA
jgi:hypothetical protein